MVKQAFDYLKVGQWALWEVHAKGGLVCFVPGCVIQVREPKTSAWCYRVKWADGFSNSWESHDTSCIVKILDEDEVAMYVLSVISGAS